MNALNIAYTTPFDRMQQIKDAFSPKAFSPAVLADFRHNFPGHAEAKGEAARLVAAAKDNLGWLERGMSQPVSYSVWDKALYVAQAVARFEQLAQSRLVVVSSGQPEHYVANLVKNYFGKPWNDARAWEALIRNNPHLPRVVDKETGRERIRNPKAGEKVIIAAGDLAMETATMKEISARLHKILAQLSAKLNGQIKPLLG